jgi:hypothetical protein
MKAIGCSRKRLGAERRAHVKTRTISKDKKSAAASQTSLRAKKYRL